MTKLQKKINNLSEIEAKEMALELLKTSYILVPWPDSQDFMEKDWFEKEAILSEESSYFIPSHRLFNS